MRKRYIHDKIKLPDCRTQMLFQKHVFFIGLLFIFSPFLSVMAAEPDSDFAFKSADEILDLYHEKNPTPCASKIFADALYANADQISPDTPEYLARAWAKEIIQSPKVLTDVLNCPELQISDTKTVNFSPITYQFSNGRQMTINYATQPKSIKQHIMLASKPSLPNDDISPDLLNTDPEKFGKYMHTEPAWYAIMVVQHDSLSEFVGPNKNNTLAVKYINEHISDIYPHGYYCTSKSAIAYDNDTINIAARKTVDLEEDDKNDYYVAGDVNLGWVKYAEIAADVLLTVGTAGLGEAAMVAAKTKNATRAVKGAKKTLRAMREIPKVKDYVKVSKQIATHTDDIAKLTKNADDYAKLLKNLDKAKKAGKPQAEVTKIAKQAREILDKSEKIDPRITTDILRDADKMSDHLKPTKEALKTLTETAENLVKTDKNVAKYKEGSETVQELLKYRKELTAYKRPKTGNFLTRTLKTIKASNSGAKEITKASKLARAGMSSRSARVKEWLFETTLKYGARLARFERDTSLLAGVVSFIGDMYDDTSNTSKEFSNGIEFKPLCLLSADDLEGYDNVVNYGMWLLWEGDSADPADDDAAYLQAMDFADKFNYNLNQVQSEQGANCNVDIYVVRPIIKLDETNPNNPSGEMFYLFMNDIPWTTAETFSDQITDIEQWDNEQAQRYEQNPIKERGYKLPSEIQSTESETDNTNTTENETE